MTISMSLAPPDVLDAIRPDAQRTMTTSRLAGVGSAVLGRSYSQQEVLDTFNITDPKIRSIFLGSAIGRRFLSLPPAGPDGTRAPEEQGDLLRKHKKLAFDLGARALGACLKDAGAEL